MTRPLSKLVLPCLAVFLLSPLAACQTNKSMKTISNEQLIAELQSASDERAQGATTEVFARGESIIPLLLSLKGNRTPFAGAPWLGRTTGGQLIFPAGRNAETGSDVPVEVAALYLINAIYRAKLDFAQSPYLTDLAIAADKREAKNTPELIERAWQSAERWAELLKSVGMERLRKDKRGPLDDSKVAFW